MQEVLKYLTQITPPRNYKNIASLNEVANYLKERFSQIGLATSLLSQKDVQVLGMINYEMIGYFTEEKVDISMFSHFITTKNAPIDKGNFIAIVSDEQSRDFMSMFRFANVENEIQHIEAVLPPQIVPITASDHLNFWENGYKAIMVTDTAHFRNPNYHTKNDTLDTLDLEKMSHVVDLIVEGIKNMALAHD